MLLLLLMLLVGRWPMQPECTKSSCPRGCRLDRVQSDSAPEGWRLAERWSMSIRCSARGPTKLGGVSRPNSILYVTHGAVSEVGTQGGGYRSLAEAAWW